MQKDVDQRVFVNLSLHTDGVVVVARHPTPKDLDCKETSKTSRKQHHHAQTPGGHVPAVQLWLSLPTWLGCPTQALPANTVGLPNTGSPCQYSWAAQLRLSLPSWLQESRVVGANCTHFHEARKVANSLCWPD